MNTSLRVGVLTIVLLSLVGCQSKMTPVTNFYDQHINSELSRDQIQKAIRVGAVTAGWSVDEVSDSQMLATYRIRSHIVVVSIDYPADDYSIQYKSSVNMKVRCGEVHDLSEPEKVTTGRSPCPGGAPPTFIHRNYKAWIDELHRAIEAALQAFLS
jgi:hypothetical protein